MEELDGTLQLAECYKLLAVFFYEPDKELWREEKLCSRLTALLQKVAPGIVPFVGLLESALEKISEEQLTVEYAALFVGPFELLAPPYGSVYLDKTGRLMGDSTMAVLKWYEQEGLQVEVEEAPDHIALELEFIYYLGSREAAMVAAGNADKQQHYASTQTVFIRTLLLPWLPQFCEKIRQGAENEFYPRLADCLEQFVGKAVALDTIATHQSACR